MKNKFSITKISKHLFYAMLVAGIFTSCANETKKEKYRIIKYQGYSVVREMGINDKYDTTYSYRAINIKDSTIFIYKTDDKFEYGDIVMVDNTLR